MSFDKSIFLKLNHLAGKSLCFDFLIIFCASFLPWLALGLALFSLPLHRMQALIIGVLNGLLALLIKQGILLFYQRPRPYLVLSTVKKLIKTAHFEDLQAFPSSHALFFFGFFVAVFWHSHLLGIFLFFMGIIMGLGRIAGGVHWPSDILAGMGIGAATGIIFTANLAQFVNL